MSNITDWPPVANYPSPSIDPSLQVQLSRIGGLTLDGLPRLRLVWGQSREATVFWRGRQRLRYLFKTTREVTGWKGWDKDGKSKIFHSVPSEALGLVSVEPQWEEIDIGIPRWYIEQLMPVSLACEGWDDIRYDVDEKGVIVDSMGPPPTAGEYQEAFYLIAEHLECCSPRAKLGCVGEYRAPSQKDINHVRELYALMESEPYKYSWEESPPPEVLLQDLKDRAAILAERQRCSKEETAYVIKDSIAPHTLFGGGHWDLGQAFRSANNE